MKRYLVALLALLPSCAFAQVTPNLQLNLPADGTSGWGASMRQNFTLLDGFLSGVETVPMITLSGSITNANQAATKAYVDAHASGITLTTTGTSGPATLTGGVLNVPQYAGAAQVYPGAGVAVSTGTAWGTSLTLATVATSGSYTDLTSKPTIPAAQVNSDWNSVSGVSQILNKPTIPAAQVNSDWSSNSGLSQILNKPTLGTAAAHAATDFQAAPATNNNFVFVGDSITGGLHSSTGALTCGTTVPSGYAATTTASGSGAPSTTMTVASAAGIQVGQYAVQSPSLTPGVFPGALVTAVSGTTITLSIQNNQAFTNQTFKFYNADPVSVAMTLPNFNGAGTAFSCGVPGWTSGLLVGDYGGRIHPLSPIVTGTPGFLFVMIGVNDINVSNSSAATIESNLATEWEFAKDDGFTVVAETILPAPFTAAQAQVWQQVNAWIRAQNGLWSRLIDMANIMPNNYDSNLFYSGDFEHLSNAGYAMIAHALNQQLSTKEGVFGSPQPFTPPFNYGTTFTATGCSNSTLIGGSTAGSFHSGTSGTCTVVITTGLTASTGYVCRANDLTTNTDSASWSQTASTTTTATISGTTVSGDVVNFACAAY